jgi:hypothetical protein
MALCSVVYALSISFGTMDLHLKQTDMKINEVCKNARNTTRKYG